MQTEHPTKEDAAAQTTDPKPNETAVAPRRLRVMPVRHRRTVDHPRSPAAEEDGDDSPTFVKPASRSRRKRSSKTTRVGQCSICIENFSAKGDGSRVTCPACKFEACRRCILRYMVDHQEPPHCMNTGCRVEWVREVLVDLFPKTTLKTQILPHVASVLMERERSLIPVTAEVAKLTREHREAAAAVQFRVDEERRIYLEMKKLTQQYAELIPESAKKGPGDVGVYDAYGQIARGFLDRETEDEYYDLYAAIKKRRAKITDNLVTEQRRVSEMKRSLDRDFDPVTGQRRDPSTRADEDSNSAPAPTVRPCPVTGCRGFVDAEDDRCMACKAEVCPKCLCVAEDEHTCDPQILANVKAIETETKQCPSCAARVYKVSGCFQMFCTHCKTPFDWKTGNRLGLSRYHNPHYVEWRDRQRSLGKPMVIGVLNDVPLTTAGERQLRIGRMVHRLRQDIRDLGEGGEFEHSAIAARFICDACVALEELEEVVNRNAHRSLTQPESNLDIRIGYILGEFRSDLEFQRLVHRRAVRRDRERSNQFILEAFVQAAYGTFEPAYHYSNENCPVPEDVLDQICDSLESLRDYTNSRFAEVSRVYSCIVTQISPVWALITFNPRRSEKDEDREYESEDDRDRDLEFPSTPESADNSDSAEVPRRLGTPRAPAFRRKLESIEISDPEYPSTPESADDPDPPEIPRHRRAAGVPASKRKYEVVEISDDDDGDDSGREPPRRRRRIAASGGPSQ